MPADLAAASPSIPGVSGRELTRSMRLNVASGALGMVWMSVAIGMPLPLLMEQVHASGFQLGLLAAAWQFAMLAQLPSTLLVEHLRRRKPWWAAVSMTHRALWAVPALLPWLLPRRRDLWPAIIILALAVSNILGQAGTGPWQSWMADLLPPAEAGRFWGARHRMLSVSLVLSAFVFGLLLDTFSKPPHEFLGFQFVFGLAAVFGFSDIALHLFVTEPALAARVSGEAVWQRILKPLRDRDFLLLTLALGIWTGGQAMVGYTMGLPGFFAMAYLKEAFGATYSQASWLFIASGIGAVLWTPRIGHWIDRLGGRPVVMRLMAIGPFFMLGWLLVSNTKLPERWLGQAVVPSAVALMCLLSLVLGGLYAGVWVCQVRLTQEHTSAAGRTVAMGVHWSMVGLIASLGPLAAGWLKDRIGDGALAPWHAGGAPMSYFQGLVLLHAALTWAVALPLLRRMR